MPSCSFWALAPDLERVLEFVFASGLFEVCESYSEPGQELRHFHSSAQLAAAYPLGVCKGRSTVTLITLLAKGSGPLLVERYALTGRPYGDGAFRHKASGWGLISLQLGGLGPKGMVASYTNHNTERRARGWADQYPELGAVTAWDWARVGSASATLNRYIRKLAIEKVAGNVVLPEAARVLTGPH